MSQAAPQATEGAIPRRRAGWDPADLMSAVVAWDQLLARSGREGPREQDRALAQSYMDRDLTWACLDAHLPMARLAATRLLERGARPNELSKDGENALCQACQHDAPDLVAALVAAGADIENQGRDGQTPLMRAAASGHLGSARALLDLGALIEARGRPRPGMPAGLTALMLAAMEGRSEMVDFLLERGADPGALDEQRRDAAHAARGAKQPALADRIVAYGAALGERQSLEASAPARSGGRGHGLGPRI